MKQAALPFGRKVWRRRPRYVETAVEADVLRACLDYLRRVGVPHWRANTAAGKLKRPDGSERFMRFGIKGQSDILGVLPGCGRLLAVECKAPGEQLRPEQAEFLAMIEHAGGVAIVAHSVGELARALTEARR
ncbi:MAG: VRR-NUC domain-containing protein [Thermoanaerobaculia bacterium]